MSNSPLKQYAELYNTKQRLKEEIKHIDEKLKELQDVVSNYFAESGVDRETVDGNTLALRRTLWAGRRADEVSPGEFADLLKGHPELAQYARESCDTQGLSAFIREIEREIEASAEDPCMNMQELREELEHRFPGIGAALNLTEKYEVRVTRSSENAARKRLAATLAEDTIPY